MIGRKGAVRPSGEKTELERMIQCCNIDIVALPGAGCLGRCPAPRSRTFLSLDTVGEALGVSVGSLGQERFFKNVSFGGGGERIVLTIL